MRLNDRMPYLAPETIAPDTLARVTEAAAQDLQAIRGPSLATYHQLDRA